RRSRYGINKKFSIPPKKARGETLSFFDKDRSERIAHSQPRQSSAAGRKKLSPYAPSPTKSAIVFHLDCSEAPELSRSNRKGLLAPIFYFFPLAFFFALLAFCEAMSLAFVLPLSAPPCFTGAAPPAAAFSPPLAGFFSFSFFFGASLIPESLRSIFMRSSGVLPRPFNCAANTSCTT